MRGRNDANHRSRHSIVHQMENFLTQTLQDHISWIWTPTQKPEISLCNPVSNRPFPDPDSRGIFPGSGLSPPGPYFLILATLPETIDLITHSFIKPTKSWPMNSLPETVDFALQSFIKSAISWPRPFSTIFPRSGPHSRNHKFHDSILYQIDNFLTQTLQEHIF